MEHKRILKWTIFILIITPAIFIFEEGHRAIEVTIICVDSEKSTLVLKSIVELNSIFHFKKNH